MDEWELWEIKLNLLEAIFATYGSEWDDKAKRFSFLQFCNGKESQFGERGSRLRKALSSAVSMWKKSQGTSSEYSILCQQLKDRKQEAQTNHRRPNDSAPVASAARPRTTPRDPARGISATPITKGDDFHTRTEKLLTTKAKSFGCDLTRMTPAECMSMRKQAEQEILYDDMKEQFQRDEELEAEEDSKLDQLLQKNHDARERDTEMFQANVASRREARQKRSDALLQLSHNVIHGVTALPRRTLFDNVASGATSSPQAAALAAPSSHKTAPTLKDFSSPGPARPPANNHAVLHTNTTSSSRKGKATTHAATTKQKKTKTPKTLRAVSTTRKPSGASILVTFGQRWDGQRGTKEAKERFLLPSATTVNYSCRVSRVGTCVASTFVFGEGCLFSCGGEVIGRAIAQAGQSLEDIYAKSSQVGEKLRHLVEGPGGLLVRFVGEQQQAYISVDLGENPTELAKAKELKKLLLKEHGEDVLKETGDLLKLIKEAENLESTQLQLEEERDESRTSLERISFVNGSVDHSASIIDFACGENFVIALANDGTCYFFGRFRQNSNGIEFSYVAYDDDSSIEVQHAEQGDDLQTVEPLVIPISKSHKPVKVSAGPQFYFIYLEDGRVLSAGLAEHGQLGRSVNLEEDVSQALLPSLCDFQFESDHVKRGWRIKKICGGAFHALFLWESTRSKQRRTRLFATGSNDAGQMGIGQGVLGNFTKLVPVSFFDEHEIVDIACGEKHSCVLVDGGILYCFGSNELGQLGVPLESTKVQGSAEKTHRYQSSMPIMPFEPLTKVIEAMTAGKTTTHAISGSPNVYAFGSGDGVDGKESHSPSRGIVALDLKQADGLEIGDVIRGFSDISVCIDHGGVIVEVDKNTGGSSLRRTLAFDDDGDHANSSSQKDDQEASQKDEDVIDDSGEKSKFTFAAPQGNLARDSSKNSGFTFSAPPQGKTTDGFIFAAPPPTETGSFVAAENSAVGAGPAVDIWEAARSSQQGWSCKVCCIFNSGDPEKCKACEKTKGCWSCCVCLNANTGDDAICRECENPEGNWRCPSCRQGNKPEEAVCRNCGNWRCLNCGQGNTSNEAVCRNCGTARPSL